MTSTETRYQSETAAVPTECENCECEHYREVLRLRRNLHDGLGAGLAGIMMRVDILPRLITHDRAAAEEVLLELRRESAAFLSEFRRMLADHGPAELDGQQLDGALNTLARRLGRAALTIAVDVDPAVAEVGRTAEVAAFWIAKEALTNVVKHANARSCTVRAWVDGGLWLEIVDDGVGGIALGRCGAGLPSMRGRAVELGGWCEVLDNGLGVTVRAFLPEEKVPML
jgi:signal transduction histidine kinase